ncbi:MAG: PAS domain S-box protein [Bacteroidota bacterium]
MGDHDKTKEELLKELHEIQQEYNSFKASYEKDIIDRKEAEKETLRYSRELATLLRISQEFATTLELAKILQIIADRVTELTELKSSAIYLLEGETLRLWATTPPLPAQFPDELRNAPLADHPHIQKAITTGMPVFLFDTAKANLTAAERDVCELRSLRSVLYLPLIIGTQALGTLIVTTSEESQKLSEEELNLLSTFANLAAMGVGNARLYESQNSYARELENLVIELKQAVEARMKSERRYLDLFSQANEGLLLMTPEGQLSDLNQAFAEMHGYTVDELKNYDIRKLDVLGDKTLEDRADRIGHILAGEVVRFEVEHYHKDGHIFPLSVTVSLIFIDDHQFFLAFHQDITERKRLEEELMKESTLMKTAVANLPIIFYLIDGEGLFQLSIGAGLKGLGLKPNQVVGLSVYEIYKDFPAIIDSIKRSLAGEPAHFESTVTGSSYDNYLAPISDINGMPVGIVGVAMDITERLSIEKALLKSERELKRAQEITHIGSWYLDIGTNQVTWSEELYKMYGFDSKEPVPPYTEHIKFLTSESWEKLSTSLTKTTETGIPYELELKIIKKDGNNGWMWVRGEAIKDIDGKTIALWGAAQDISERKLIEKELVKAKEKAEESEKKFRKSIENAPYPLMIHAEGEVIQLSEAWTRISGYTIIDIPSIVQWTSKAYGEDAIPSQEFIDKLYEVDSMQYDGEWEVTIKNGEKRI